MAVARRNMPSQSVIRRYGDATRVGPTKTDTPFFDIASRARTSALRGTRLHLDHEHARALAQNPEIQALLGRLIAEETTNLCRASQPTKTDDSWDLPLFNPEPNLSATKREGLPLERYALAPKATKCGSTGASTVNSIVSDIMTGPLGQAAASAQASVQVKETIRQSKLMKRSQRDMLSANVPQSRKSRPRSASQQS